MSEHNQVEARLEPAPEPLEVEVVDHDHIQEGADGRDLESREVWLDESE